MQKITDATGQPDDYFGHDVSISGNYIIAGAYGDDVGSNSRQGSASIYIYNGSSWVLMKKTDIVFVNITAQNKSQAVIKVYDIRGVLIKTQHSELLQGNNQVSIVMKNLPAGIYQLLIEWGNGQVRKVQRIIKQ